MTTVEDWPFGSDADRDDPLAAMRVAVTSSHPRWHYLVAFDRKSEARPTEAEARMLVSYLEDYKSYWYNDSFKATLLERPLDVDGGANGVVFHKWAEDDWGYRRQSFERGWLFTVVPPWARDEHRDGWGGPLSLARLMDRIHQHGFDQPNARWEAWKAEHPDVFPPVVL